MASKFLLVVMLVLSPGGCSRPTTADSKAKLVESTHASMGTELHVSVWTSEQGRAEATFEKISQELDRLESLMSNWKDGSDIQRLNAAAGRHPVPIADELRDLFRTARQVSDWTSGRFDVTFGVMSGLWKFDYQNKDDSIPDHNEVVRRRRLINYRDLEVDEKSGTAFLRRE